jgi:Bifunctional DNA primase/polymerase, N-terminal/Primase C terminal 2 (PriCT-2)
MNISGLGDLPVFPCASDKRPLVKAWPTSAERIEPKPSWPLVGVPTGITFSVLDIDLDGLSWLASASLPPTRTHVTRSGGRHLLFRHREGLRTSKGQIAQGVDVRGEGGFVVWWPREGLAVEERELADWPEGLGSALRKRNLPSTRAIGVGGLGDGEALAALLKLDPLDYRDHDNWLRVMMAAHAAGIAQDVFIEWSTSDPKYAEDAEIISRRWESLTVEGNANGRVTAWALLVEARMVELERYFSNHIPTAHHTCTWEVPSTERTVSHCRSTETERTAFQPTQHLKLRMTALLRMIERANGNDREPTVFRVACLVREIIAEGKLLPRVAIALLWEACKANHLWQEDRELCSRTIAAGFLTVERKTTVTTNTDRIRRTG